MSRVTRRSMAHEAAFLTSADENAVQISSFPSTSVPLKADARSKSSSKAKKSIKAAGKQEQNEEIPLPAPTSTNSNSPLKLETARKEGLPKNPTAKKRKRAVKEEDDGDIDELPHNVGTVPETKEGLEDSEMEGSPPKKASKRGPPDTKPKTGGGKSASQTAKEQKDAVRCVEQLQRVKMRYKEECVRREKAMATGKKTRSDTYGLSEGETPFPRWQHPTAEECQEVHDILSKRHPECKPQPKTVPEPSKFVAGCGEVRSILDALVRTRLSASTTCRNSSTAYQGMVQRYGLKKSGVGKDGVNYNAVRKAPVQDLYYAIKAGGLAVSKSADIKALLDIVYEENQVRRTELIEAHKTKKSSKGPKGADVENDEQKAAEIKLAEDENLSLDHHYILPTYEAIYKFMTFPGIGVKTAACVAMFCMQRPCFAVDTHVFRLAKWLGWVPPREERQKGDRPVDRDTTFSHLEVRVPDELKYMLHQLMVKHGKVCPRCRGNTGEGSVGWGDGCIIDYLVHRSGARKGGESPAKGKKASARKGRRNQESDEDEDEAMPDLTSDNEDTEPSEDGATDSEDYAPPTKTPQKQASRRGGTLAQEVKVSPAVKEETRSSAKTMKQAHKRKTPPVNGWKGGRPMSAEASREGSTDA